MLRWYSDWMPSYFPISYMYRVSSCSGPTHVGPVGVSTINPWLRYDCSRLVSDVDRSPITVSRPMTVPTSQADLANCPNGVSSATPRSDRSKGFIFGCGMV
ncbi:MAG: hypothetical protein PHT07_24895 [Paludibacter sp.]|nr:hypothetical protein [Paludibacter sp.]